MADKKVTLEAPDQVALYIKLKEEYAKLRGFDLVASPGKNVRIPRTHNNDVRALLVGWTNSVLVATTVRGRIDSDSVRKRWEKTIAKWHKAATEMATRAKAGERMDVFPNNVRFWDTTAKLAIELQSVQRLPARWTLMFEAISEAIPEAPRVLAEFVGGAAAKVAKTAGKIAGSAVGGFFGELGLGAFALFGVGAYVITRKRRR